MGADTQTPGLSMVPKLNYEHLHLTTFSKMRVDLAAQVLFSCITICIIFIYIYMYISIINI